MYYLRTNAAADAIKFTLDKSALAQPTAVDPAKVGEEIEQMTEPLVLSTVSEAQQTLQYDKQVSYEQKLSDMACSLDNPDACEACGS